MLVLVPWVLETPKSQGHGSRGVPEQVLRSQVGLSTPQEGVSGALMGQDFFICLCFCSLILSNLLNAFSSSILLMGKQPQLLCKHPALR